MTGPRTPLLRPRRYFEAHDGSPPLWHAAAAVAVVSVASAVGLAIILDQFAAALDVPITVDNPDYPGETFCENAAFDEPPAGCDEPPTVERQLGAMVAEELSWLPAAVFVIVPLWWAIQAGVLHAASALADGSGSLADTLSVAGWGMAPSLLRLVAVGALATQRLHAASVPADPDAAVAVLESALTGIELLGLAAALVVAVWAGVIRTYGLASARDLRVSTAAVVVGVLTVFGLLFELV